MLLISSLIHVLTVVLILLGTVLHSRKYHKYVQYVDDQYILSVNLLLVWPLVCLLDILMLTFLQSSYSYMA